MKTTQTRLRQLIRESLEADSLLKREIINEAKNLIIEKNGMLTEVEWGKIGSMLSKIGDGSATTGVMKKIRKFTHGNELDLSDPMWREWDSIQKRGEQIEKAAFADKWAQNPQKGIEVYQKFLDRFGKWIQKATPSLTVNLKKNTQQHKELRRFMEFQFRKIENYLRGRKKGNLKPMVGADGKPLRPNIKDFRAIWDKYKGEPLPDAPDAKSQAGKAAEKILDKSAMKPLKVAFSKATNKQSVKEVLKAIFDELPDAAKKNLKLALADLKNEL
jgi:hypothetical protein